MRLTSIQTATREDSSEILAEAMAIRRGRRRWGGQGAEKPWCMMVPYQGPNSSRQDDSGISVISFTYGLPWAAARSAANFLARQPGTQRVLTARPAGAGFWVSPPLEVIPVQERRPSRGQTRRALRPGIKPQSHREFPRAVGETGAAVA